jgi:hypothetical protein
MGLCRLSSLPAASWPFPTLSLRIFLYVQGPLPRLLLRCAHPFLPTKLRRSQRCHPAVAQVGAVHMPEVVSAGRRGTDMPCFIWVNTLLGNVKTALAGTYHAFNFRNYTHRYLAEYQYRFNRRFDLKAILSRLLRASATTGSRTDA